MDVSRGMLQPSDLFWSPFPDHYVPLQSTQHNTGPMDISTMIDVQDDWTQLGGDGFKMSHINDPILGPPSVTPNGQWPQG